MAESIAEQNSAYLANRATALNSAIQTALSSKDAPTPKPSKDARPAPGGAPTPPKAKPSTGSQTTIVPSIVAPADPSPEESTSTIADDAATGLETDAPSDDAAPEPEPAHPDVEELQAIGKKRDLRALELKLGLPEGHLGVNNGTWAAYRKRADELAAATTQHEQNESTLVQRYAPIVEAIQSARKGDLRAYANAIAKTTGVTVEQFIAYWSKNVQSIDTTGHTVQEPAPKQLPPAEDQSAKREAAIVRVDKYLTEEAGNHPAFKLQGAQEGVRKIYLASYDKATRGFKLTAQAAASQYVAERRAAHENENWILSGKKRPKAATTQTLSRSKAADAQPRDQPMSRDQAIEHHAAIIRRQKAREAVK